MMPNADAIALGKQIKAVRKAMKMTQEQLALKSNVSVKYMLALISLSMTSPLDSPGYILWKNSALVDIAAPQLMQMQGSFWSSAIRVMLWLARYFWNR